MPNRRGAILSQNLIRDQALAIIDEDGLGALTACKLAARLGAQAASLCAHFPEEAVLGAIADRLAERIDPRGSAESRQDGQRTWTNSWCAVIHSHPATAAEFLVLGAATASPRWADQRGGHS